MKKNGSKEKIKKLEFVNNLQVYLYVYIKLVTRKKIMKQKILKELQEQIINYGRQGQM